VKTGCFDVAKREPTQAEQRLWIARIAAEEARGATPHETVKIFKQILESWEAVRDGEPIAVEKAHGQPNATTRLLR